MSRSEIGERESRNKRYGVAVGIVTNNIDPDGKYRVKVRFPWLSNGGEDAPTQEEGDWYRIASVMAGPDRGLFCLPEVNDEVLVAFEHGDIARGFIIGALWNGVDKPTLGNKTAAGKVRWASGSASGASGEFVGRIDAGKNDIRSFTSRKFHQLIFNDNAGSPRVALHSSAKHRIVLNDDGGAPTQIEIYDGTEENYILIDTKNKKITIESKTGDMLLKAKKTIRLEAKTIETDSQQGTSMKVGSNFQMTAGSNASLKASATMNLQASTINMKGRINQN